MFDKPKNKKKPLFMKIGSFANNFTKSNYDNMEKRSGGKK